MHQALPDAKVVQWRSLQRHLLRTDMSVRIEISAPVPKAWPSCCFFGPAARRTAWTSPFGLSSSTSHSNSDPPSLIFVDHVEWRSLVGPNLRWSCRWWFWPAPSLCYPWLMEGPILWFCWPVALLTFLSHIDEYDIGGKLVAFSSVAEVWHWS